MDNKSRRLTPARAAIAGLALAALPMASFAFVSVGVSITIAPPAIPVYVQPPCPAVGYIWTPGYWAYGDDDYYWVPGTWVLAPSPGLLWTPGYWGWDDGFYAWHAGYWGPHVGFYGGVNYGFGYGGVGFEGGYWRGGAFYYNRSVSNLGDVHITNVYNKTVINNVNVTRVSYNGGEGGLRARPNSSELAAENDRHVAFTSMQRNQEHAAFTNHDLRASVNQGRPRIAATERPGVFTGHGVEAARAGEWRGGGDRAGAARGPDARVGADRAGAARGPDARGGADRGGPLHGAEVHAADRGAGHSGPEHLATRSDRPPGASGSAEVRNGTGGGSAVRVDRPSMGGNRGEPAAHFSTRNDRPPSASEVHGGSGNAGAFNNRTESHEQPRVNVARNDRPSPPMGGNAGVNRNPQPHFNQNNEMRNLSQGGRPGGSPQASPREFNGGGASAPRQQMAPRPEAAPRPQMAPRPEAAPRQQMAPRPEAAPRPEMQRGGGEPRGQGGGRPQGPQGRGGEHGRR